MIKVLISIEGMNLWYWDNNDLRAIWGPFIMAHEGTCGGQVRPGDTWQSQRVDILARKIYRDFDPGQKKVHHGFDISIHFLSIHVSQPLRGKVRFSAMFCPIVMWYMRHATCLEDKISSELVMTQISVWCYLRLRKIRNPWFWHCCMQYIPYAPFKIKKASTRSKQESFPKGLGKLDKMPTRGRLFWTILNSILRTPLTLKELFECCLGEAYCLGEVRVRRARGRPFVGRKIKCP